MQINLKLRGSNVFLCLIILAASIASCNRDTRISEKESQIIQELDSLVRVENYFVLRSYFNNHKEELNKRSQLIYSSYVDQIFSKNAGITEIQKLANSKERSKLRTRELLVLMDAELQYYLKAYNYAKTDSIIQEQLKHCSSIMDSVTKADLQMMQRKYNTLKDIPSPVKNQITDNEIPVFFSDGHHKISIKFKNEVINLILDSGCHRSVIAGRIAKRNNMKEFKSGLTVTGTTGKKLNTWLAVADEIKIADITLNNLVFEVIEDSLFGSPEHNYFIDGIIGNDILSMLGEIQIHKGDSIFIPAHPNHYTEQNMVFKDFTVLLDGEFKSDTILLKLDTGSGHSIFFKPFYDRYENNYLKDYPIETYSYAGIGGTNSFHICRVDSLEININNKEFTLEDLVVHKGLTIKDDPRKYHALLGYDAINQYEKLIISYEENAIIFE